MAALTCDICGGKLIMGAGGIAVCDSCGMEHSSDRMKEKIQEIKGTVRVDNSHMIDNWMKLGTSAAAAGNNKEAYDYFTKVVEVEPENWRAVYEKGKAGAWQSTLGNLRISEIYQGITTALEIINKLDLSTEELSNIKNEFAVALFNINNAITDLMEENLFNINDKYFDSHWDQMWETRQRHLTNVKQLEDALSLIKDLDDDLSKNNVIEFKKRMCEDLKDACASIQYWRDYSQNSLGYFGYSSSEKIPHIDKFWSLVADIREIDPTFATQKYTQIDPFDAGFELNRSDRILSYWKQKDAEIKQKKEREAAHKRFKEYWDQHKEEKQKLEEQLSSLDNQISKIKDELKPSLECIRKLIKESQLAVPAEEDLKLINKTSNDLINLKNKLGLFQGKKKKELQEQIDNLTEKEEDVKVIIKHQREELQKKAKGEIELIKKEIEPLQNNLVSLENERKEILHELNKPR